MDQKRAVTIGPRMKKICEEIERQANEEVACYRLTFTQAKVILFLVKHDKMQASQKELEDFLMVSHPTTVTILKSMEEKGLLESYRDPKDRRMKMVRLLWGNDEIYKELENNSLKMEEKLLKNFTEKETEEFIRMLNKMYGNLC